MTTIQLKYSGTKLYRGYDADRKVQVVAFPGSTHDVSPGKADQLLRDFPKDWSVPPRAPGEPPAVISPASKVQEVQAPAPAPEPAPAPKAGQKKKAQGRR